MNSSTEDYKTDNKRVKKIRKRIRDFRNGDLATFKEIFNIIFTTGDNLITKELVLEVENRGVTVNYYFEDFLYGVNIYKTYYNKEKQEETTKTILSATEIVKLLESNNLCRIKELKTL